MKKIFQTSVFRIGLTCCFYIISAHIFSQDKPAEKYQISQAAAEKIVQRVVNTSPVIDGHNDVFVKYMDCRDCPRDLTDYRIDTINNGHTDLIRLKKGGAGGMLINIFGQDTGKRSYLLAWDLLYRMEAAYSKKMKVVKSSIDMKQAMDQGKIAFLPSLEGAVRLEDHASLLRMYYRLGLRSVTFAYKTNALADGSDDTARHNGVSTAGREMIKEMNRLGVIIDMSHISEKSMNDILDISSAPVIFSHSNVKALCNVNRNVSDNVLQRLKVNRGIIMLTFVPYFVAQKHSNWLDAGDAVYYKAVADHPGKTDTVNAIMEHWEKNNPEPLVTVSDMADHFDYVKKLIGVDHIGMAGDFDGIQFTIRGLENTSTYPNLLIELARRGWSESDLKKITGQNFLRVFGEVEREANQKQ